MCIYIYIHIYPSIYLSLSLSICIYIYIYTYIYIYIYPTSGGCRSPFGSKHRRGGLGAGGVTAGEGSTLLVICRPAGPCVAFPVLPEDRRLRPPCVETSARRTTKSGPMNRIRRKGALRQALPHSADPTLWHDL